MRDERTSAIGFLQPALLISLATVMAFYAGWSLLEARVKLARLPAGEIHLQFHEYIMLGIYPATLFLLPLLLTWVAIFLARGKPGPKLVTFVVIYPALIIALTHVIDHTFDEVIVWGVGAVVFGILWWNRARLGNLAAARDWHLRLGYSFIIVLAVGHVGAAFGHLVDLGEKPILLEMNDANHPLHNRTMDFLFHASGNYYVRELDKESERSTHIIPESNIRRIIVGP